MRVLTAHRVRHRALRIALARSAAARCARRNKAAISGIIMASAASAAAASISQS
jgi:hypothetical protein